MFGVEQNSTQQGSAQDRRGDRRAPTCIPARIDTPRRDDRFAMTRDVSRTGALLATPSRLQIGEKATLIFHDGEKQRSVAARVVRLELNRNDMSGIWRYFVAVEFTQPLPDEAVLTA